MGSALLRVVLLITITSTSAGTSFRTAATAVSVAPNNAAARIVYQFGTPFRHNIRLGEYTDYYFHTTGRFRGYVLKMDFAHNNQIVRQVAPTPGTYTFVPGFLMPTRVHGPMQPPRFWDPSWSPIPPPRGGG